MKEKWKSIKGYEGLYEVSDQGRVRGIHRTLIRSDGKTVSVKGVVLAGGVNRGYRTVTLKKIGDKQRTFRVHQLVAWAFLGRQPGFEVRHKNGIRKDCRLDNLEYGTRQENADDMMAHGTRLIGSNHPRSVLTEQDVRQIRERRRGGETYKSIATDYGMSLTGIYSAVHRLWKHI